MNLRNISIMSLALGVMCLANPSQAKLATYSGWFEASGFPGGAVPDPFNGSFSFEFDDSVLSGVGYEFFLPLPLITLNLSPDVVGSTQFTTANTGVKIDFQDGQLDTLVLGGSPSGVSSISQHTDDFNVRFLASTGEVAFFHLANQSVDFIRVPSTFAGGFTVSVVPEPSTLLCMLALFSAGLLRRPRGLVVDRDFILSNSGKVVR